LSGESHQKLWTLRRFLAAAAIWHVTFVLAVFVIGRAQLAPQTFDRNGIGLSFAIDARSYRIEAENMAGKSSRLGGIQSELSRQNLLTVFCLGGWTCWREHPGS
jgi:hypothetical protein